MSKYFLKKFLFFIIVITNIITMLLIPHSRAINAEVLLSSNAKDRLELIKERGVLNVITSINPPFSYINPETNELTGINGDIIREIARRLGIKKVEVKKIVPFEDLLTTLNNNEDIDLISDRIAVSEERKKQILFTNILYKETEAILVPKTSKIVRKEDLKNAVVGAQQGTLFLELAKKWKENNQVKEVVAFKDPHELASAVNACKIDAGIADSILSTYLLSSDDKLYLKILYPYEPELFAPIAVAVKNSDITLVQAINKELDAMKRDKTLLKILETYGLTESNFVDVEKDHLYTKNLP